MSDSRHGAEHARVVAGNESGVREPVDPGAPGGLRSICSAYDAETARPANLLTGGELDLQEAERLEFAGAAVTGCPAGQPSTAAVSGLSVSCSAIGGGAAPRSRWTRLCHHTGIPSAPAPMRSFGEPATNSTASGATANSSSA